MTTPSPRDRCKTGLTLIELLIVVAILGIVSGIAVPRATNTVGQFKEATLQSNLVTLRKAFEQYRSQHGGGRGAVFPGQLTITTDRQGAPGSTYGPYIRQGFPANPINEDCSVRTVTRMPAGADGRSGWLYDICSGEIRANVDGAGPSGCAYYEL